MSAEHADDLVFTPATELAARMRDKRLSPVALTRAYLERIDRLDGTLRAYITVCKDQALAEAERCEQAVTRGAPLGPLHGVPIAVKDQIEVAGIRTTAGSRLLRDNIATNDAPVIARLRASGAILLGKLNLTEFALGGTLQFPYGQPRNPWNVDHDPGGSSSGSGIAAAAALAAATLGEDTGGSIRSPASNCGAVGHRPTWGLVPRAGCIPLCHTMDAIGPITRTVEDAALLMSIIAGPDAGDPLMRQSAPEDVLTRLRDGVTGLRIGLVRELTSAADTDRDTSAAVMEAAETFRKLGARVDEVSLPLIPLAGAVFMALGDSEGAGQHAQWLRTRADEYDVATRRRLVAASLLPATAYHQATRARALIARQVLDVLTHVDLLLAPTQPGPAPRIASGQAPVASKQDAATRFFRRRSYTTPFSLAATPAISVPCGFTTAGLPIGLQLAGRRYDDATVLRAAFAYEQATPWHRRRPPG
jgi:aspartyl-tRNA(Asn)/glutamyl-tRNA(Gln) amidotransferase subunit A